MNIKCNPKFWSAKLTNIITGLIGIILILIAIILGKDKTFSVIMISVGTSILASAIITSLNSKYIIQQFEIKNIIDEWGLVNIYRTRSEMNKKSNELLKNTKNLDIIAMGLKGFRDAKNTDIENYVQNGLKIRILTIDPNSEYLNKIDFTEGLAEGSTKSTINSLVKWVNELKKVQTFDGQVQIKTYNHYPYEFYFSMDDTIFIGPYQNRTSQQTITYEYNKLGSGHKIYKENFEILWRNSNEQ